MARSLLKGKQMSDTPKVNLVVNQGSTFKHRFKWTDSRKKAIDITGYTARMQIRSSVSDATVLASLTTENGGIILGGALGTIDLFISHTATTAYAWTKAVYDIELINLSTEVTRIVEGTVKNTLEVTR